ncbi:MAG TPA: pyridoxal-dependent decarboxylase [Polyangia bacterium]|nr:pyridoxal-dependent decarboxylase [Polyangia bacterium]
MDDVLQLAARLAREYLDGLHARAVTPTAQAIERLAELRVPVPDGPSDAASVLTSLDDVGSPATMATAGGRFFGFVTGASLPVAVGASWLGTAWDQNAAMSAMSPIAVALERVVLEWLRELLALPDGSVGALVTGGTMASFTALAAARRSVLARAGWNVDDDGLFGAPPITVVVGDEVHVAVVKALGLLGLGRSRVVRVATDDQGRMRAAELPRLDGPTIVCTQAGNVNTGACDPIGTIADAAHARDAWVHVDGAFGLWAAAAPARAPLVAGAERADSWAVDAHKWLNVPYDSGVAFVRDGAALRGAMTVIAPYLTTGGPPEPCHATPEMSRRARAVEIWAVLRTLGRAGVAELVERCCRHAARFAERLRAAGYEVLNDVVLNQLLVSFGDDARTDAVVAAVQRDGTLWCGPTVWHDRRAMRISVASWATSEADVERAADAIINLAAL